MQRWGSSLTRQGRTDIFHRFTAYFFLLSASARRSSYELFGRLGVRGFWALRKQAFKQVMQLTISLVDRLYFAWGQTDTYTFQRDGWEQLEAAPNELVVYFEIKNS